MNFDLTLEDKPWDSQSVLKGSNGNDEFRVKGRKISEKNKFIDTTFFSSRGNDIFLGSDEIDFVDYSNFYEVDVDRLSGMYISDNPSNLPIVSDNLSPVISQAFKEDPFLAFKGLVDQYSHNGLHIDNLEEIKNNYLNYSPALFTQKNINLDESLQVDFLHEIDVIKLTSYNDYLELSSSSQDNDEPIIDFFSGYDKAILKSKGKKPNIENYFNLEELIWQPLKDDGERMIGEDGKEMEVYFDVKEIYEDEIILFSIDNYPPIDHINRNWILSDFELNPQTNFFEPNTDDWISVKYLEPTPDLVGDNKVIISSKVIKDHENKNWLEIHVHDKRQEGKGLVGLEIDLSWSKDSMRLIEEDLSTEIIFDYDSLPLFQNYGSLSDVTSLDIENSQRTLLSGLGAASLPSGNKGKALGNTKSEDTNTLFARIAFDGEDSLADIDLHINPTLVPPAGAVEIFEKDILILDSRSEKVAIIEAKPTQETLGNFSFSLVDENSPDIKKNLSVLVREVNDPPEVKIFSGDQANILSPSNKQDNLFTFNSSNLFIDVDDINLSYSLENHPEWLSINESTGLIKGVPANEDVGISSITIKVDDNRGGSAFQEIVLDVKNVNDNPEVNVEIKLPKILQGQSFTYRLPEDAFVDPDLDVDQHEKLTYELIPISDSNDSKLISNWISIDEDTGTITGTPKNINVGTNSFRIKATDAYGLSCEQTVHLIVENINDAPYRTKVLEDFLESQVPTLEGEKPPLESDNNAIFTGLTRQIDLSNWFGDVDMKVNNNERLNISVEYDNGLGDKFEIGKQNDNSLDWISWEKDSNLLTLSPNIMQLGEHIIRVVATDLSGLSASVLVPLLVRHRNSSPHIEINDSTELISKIRSKGIKDITSGNSTDSNNLVINLLEETEYSLTLPLGLFGDRDLSIDRSENLTYKLLGGEDIFGSIDENKPFNFDASTLTIKGDTTGLAANVLNGKKSWDLVLRAIDSSEEFVDYKINMILERTAIAPILNIKQRRQNNPEGSETHLKDLIVFEMNSRENDFLKLEIIQKSDDKIKLDLLNKLKRIDDKIISRDNDGKWIFDNLNAKQALDLINNLSFLVKDDDNAIGDFNISICVQSTLGNTGLRSELVSEDISFTLFPVADLPIWKDIENNTDSIFDFQTFASFALAESSDPREVITYEIALPEGRSDINITSKTGDLLGFKEGNLNILNSDEWNQAVLRTNRHVITREVIDIRAISSESNSPSKAFSEIKNISLYAIPFISTEPNLLINPPQEIQKAGDITTFSVDIQNPSGSNSLLAEIELPLDFTFLDSTDDFELLSTSQNTKDKTRIYKILKDINKESDRLELKVLCNESFSGIADGKIKVISSSRKAVEFRNYFNSLESELINKIASESDFVDFRWQVRQVAKNPEFNLSEASSLSFDADTGKLNIGIRRGSSTNGTRNPAEVLTLSIRNIPNGYFLAEKNGGEFNAVGATDAFGTMTLFNLTSKENDDIDKFRLINNGNLYLVSTINESNDPYSGIENIELSLALSSRISDQPGGDSRSQTIVKKLQINQLNSSLGKVGKYVDPLFIDIKGEGLSLTSLSKNAAKVKFKMLPSKDEVSTSWLSSNANYNSEYNNGLLVFNNTLDNNLKISSIEEIFSEYYKSINGERTFLTGISALASLDSNLDYIINKNDDKWENIFIWFDDGDAKFEIDETKHLGDFVDSIDLGSKKTIINQPLWAEGNKILRSIKASDHNNSYNLYDVGLRVSPSSNSNIDLNLESEYNSNSSSDSKQKIELFENGDPVYLKLTSSQSKQWEEKGLESLTLVRLSGLPKEIVPALGVKDSRGDWLFTWADLNANQGKVQLIPDNNWSGESNIKILISQLQIDGTLINSPLSTIALDVIGVSDKPILQLSKPTIKEDSTFLIKEMILVSELLDKDGSEELLFEIDSLPEGVKLIKNKGKVNQSELQAINSKFLIEEDDMELISITPPLNFSGNLQFNISAIAKEKYFESSSINKQTANIFIQAIADAPINIDFNSANLAIKANSFINLADIFEGKTYPKLLTDNDNSEELRLKFELPKNIDIAHKTNSNWEPVVQLINNDKLEITCEASDINNLKVIDKGNNNIEKIQIYVTPITREKSNGNIFIGTKKSVDIEFIRNALPAKLNDLSLSNIKEDSDPISLNRIISADPSHPKDSLSYLISDMSSGLSLYDKNGNRFPTSESNSTFEVKDIDQWSLNIESNISGVEKFNVVVVSDPGRGGEKALTNSNCIEINIDAVADIPILNLNKNPEDKLSIESNGWLKISSLEPKIESSDKDGSEELSLLIGALDDSGKTISLPSQSKFSVPAKLRDDGLWEVQANDVRNLSLYLGEIADDLSMSFTSLSKDSNNYRKGEKLNVIVAANAVVRVPLLEVQGAMEGYEDQPIPILSKLDGVVKAQLRGNGAGQTLELELKDLPTNSKIVLKEENNISKPINQDENGNFLSSLRLPYHQWDKAFWLTPPNEHGSFKFYVQAYSIGKQGKTLSTDSLEVRLEIKSFNDPPQIVQFSDPDPCPEGKFLEWDLLDLFDDVDNKKEELDIEVSVLNSSGSKIPLPKWLSLSDKGLLSGKPSNTDVGILKLDISATDPLGQSVSTQRNLEIGDVNASPVFNSKVFNKWGEIKHNGKLVFTNTLDLRSKIEINLAETFTDEDIINGDILTYELSKNGLDWVDNISNFVSIKDHKLTILPTSKKFIGTNDLFIRAKDKLGLNVIQQLRLLIRNVNDPPIVNRSEASLVREGLWKEEINVLEDSKSWKFNIEGLFKDADIGDRIDQITPNSLPDWLHYHPSNTNTGGILSGKPSNEDVGVQELEWQAIDNRGDTAKYKLKINILNTNDNPYNVVNPDLSELGENINNRSQLDEDGYSRLDFEEIFKDPDQKHGDLLNYKVKSIISEDTNEELDADWIGITYRSSKRPDYSRKLLVEPVFYSVLDNGDTGKLLTPEEINKLHKGDQIRVAVEATDDRDVKLKGIIGIDLDISFSSALSLIKNSIEITSNLPLYRSVTEGDGGVRLTAGSAPDGGLNIGKPVGDSPNEKIVTFDLLVKEPEKRFVVSVSAGKGKNRDGIMSRTGEEFKENNSILHSFSSREGADLEILAPDNSQVGKYTVLLEARDIAGSKAEAKLKFNVNNTNDLPDIIDINKPSLLRWLNGNHYESRETKSNIINLFDDPDLIHGDSLNVSIKSSDKNERLENISFNDSIKLSNQSDGKIALSIKPPSGITKIINRKFMFDVKDLAGANFLSEEFTVDFLPTAKLTKLTKGNEIELDSYELGSISTKNVDLNLSNTLKINAPILLDKLGDQAFLNLRVNSNNPKLLLHSSNDASFYTKKSINTKEHIFSIDLAKLSEITEKAYGNLDNILLRLDDNQLELIPRELSPKPIAGIPIDIWTETRVLGDSKLEFGSIKSDNTKIWIPIDNISPVFKGASAVAIKGDYFEEDSSNFKEEIDTVSELKESDETKPIKENFIHKTLFDLSNLFVDLDVNDKLDWEIDLPKRLRGLIELDKNSGHIRFSSKVSSEDDLPFGHHKILVRCKDTSGVRGESSGVSNGILRLFLGENDKNSSSMAKGLDLISSGNKSDLKEIFSNIQSGNQLSETQNEVVNIMKRLKVNVEDKQSRELFIDKLSEGSLSILARDDESKPIIMFDASKDEDNLLLESGIKDVEEDLIFESNILFNQRDIADTPFGEIDFSIDTKGDQGTIVELYLEDNSSIIDSIVKTDINGTPYLFNAETISYQEEIDGELGQWLESLEYGINYYGLDLPSNLANISNITFDSKDDIAEKLAISGFDFSNLGYIDGSAYLIDLDNDSTTDLITILLIDQGFFDTNSSFGIIGDPLIPVTTVPIEVDSNMSSILNTTSSLNKNTRRLNNLSSYPNMSVNLMKNKINSLIKIFNNVGSFAQSKNKNLDAYMPDDDYYQEQINAKTNLDETENTKAFMTPLLENIRNLPKEMRQSLNNLTSILKNNNNSESSNIASILGFLLIPMFAERTITGIAKNVNMDIKFKLQRRNEHFNGEWNIPSRTNRIIKIKSLNSKISLKELSLHKNHENLVNLPGFDEKSHSLLSKVAPLSRHPGKLIKSLNLTYQQLLKGDSCKIDWDSWLRDNIPVNLSLRSNFALRKLRKIINDKDISIEYLDIIMLAQINDCRIMYGLDNPPTNLFKDDVQNDYADA